MAKKRVHEIAKAHGLSSKAVLDALQADGVDVATASSSVDEAAVERLIKTQGKKLEGAAKAEPASGTPAPKTTGASAPTKSAGGATPARPVRPPAPGEKPAAPQRPVARPVRPPAPGAKSAPQRPVARPVRPAAPGTPAASPQRPAGGPARPVRPAAPGSAPQRPVRPQAPGARPAAPTGQRPAAPSRPQGGPGGPPQRPVRPQAPGGGAPQRPVRRGEGEQRPAPRPAPRQAPTRQAPGGLRPGAGPRIVHTAPPAAPAKPKADPAPLTQRAAPLGRRPAPAGQRPAGGQRPPARPNREAPREAPQRPVGPPPGRAGGRGPGSGPPLPPGQRPAPGSTTTGPPRRPARRAAKDTPPPPPTRDLRTKKPEIPKVPTALGEKPAAGAGPKIIALPDPATSRPQRAGGSGGSSAGGPGKRRVVIDQPGGPRRPGLGGPPNRRPRRRRRRQSIEEALAPLNRGDQGRTVDVVRINSGSTVKDVAEYLGVPVPEVIKKLMLMGEMATLTQTLPDDTIELLAGEFEREIEIVSASDEEIPELVFDDDEEDLEVRPPVVTIMGHVDHGKTSLLDKLRETEVAEGEAGGITQHIGAYQVHQDDLTITFLDTPGHAAFTAMRARGARLTDIAVIVVAADDGVKPQTEEAIDHARAADVPIIVAINKIDKPNADPTRVRTELVQHGLNPVEWGGDTEFVDVSAKTGEGLDTLIETIGLVAEISELTANANTEASGVVIEARLDSGRGPVATVLIQRGTLEIGDPIVCGPQWGKVRALIDYTGERIEVAGPGDPVLVLGFNGVPDAGDTAIVVESEKVARERAEERETRLKSEAIARRSGRKFSLEDVFKRSRSADELKGLALILKADVAGSLEAFEDEIARLPQSEVLVDIVRSGVGAITESDVMLAAASEAIIIGFNVGPVGEARRVADHEGVEIRTYDIIYRALEDLHKAMEGLLDPDQVEDVVGTAEVRQVFRASKVGTIAGSYVTDGKIRRNVRVRVIRDGDTIATTKIESLKRFNEDAREVATGFECGIVLREFADVREGDVIEAFETRSVNRELK
jgi:translation initiation factor IF-2